MGGFNTQQFNTAEFNAGAAQPGPMPGFDVAGSVTDAIYRLGFQSAADLAASGWIGVDELYAFADDAAKKLAYETGVFVTYDDSITAAAETAVYLLQTSNVFTLYVWLNGVPLRITRVAELEALDGNWPATVGPTTRCAFDAGSAGTISLYPSPSAGGALQQVCQEYPGTVALGSSLIDMPSVAQDYFTYAMLAGGRGKESEAAMPEMAAHYGERLKMYEQVFEHLWGPGQ